MAGYKRVVLTERDRNLSSNYEANSVKKQLDKFDNSYTSKKLNELYNEFDAITFNTPTSAYSTLTDASVYTQKQNLISFKTKLYLTSAIIISLLLAFLTIYNIFVINQLNGGIELLQEEVTVTENEYKNVYDYYNQLKNTANIADRVAAEGFAELSSNSVVSIPLVELQNVESVDAHSNWFNEFCDFLGGIFGG